MSNRVNMQHYVPRSYLRNFAIDKDTSSPQVYCYSKIDRNVFQTSLSNIAGEGGFYDIPEDPDQRFESWLSNIEGRFSSALRKLVDDETLDVLDDEDRSSIALTVEIQELRTRERREFHREMFANLHDRLQGESLGPKAEKQFEELKELETTDGLTRFQREVVVENAPGLAAILLKLKWILFKNVSDSPFWTSDHPIVRCNNVDHSPYGGLGIAKRGIEVYLPLSPTLVLSFADPEIYGNLPSKSRSPPENVTFLNQLQLWYSTRHVISDSENFDMAEDFLDEHPEAAEIDRQRINRFP